MTSAPSYFVFIVPSISHAMKAEKALTRAGIPNKLIPVPRTLSSQCGVCLRVAEDDRDRATQALKEAGVEISTIHRLPDRSRTEGGDR